jgi:hypothetical protein
MPGRRTGGALPVLDVRHCQSVCGALQDEGVRYEPAALGTPADARALETTSCFGAWNGRL